MRLLISFLFLATVLSFPPVYASTVIDVPIEEDTYIEEKFPTIAPWNNRNLFLGTDTWYAKGKNRILIKPNFANLQNQDILFSDIEKVELIITAYEYEGTDLVATIDSYTTTSPWSMFTATWNIQPSITSKKDSTVITTGAGEKLLTVTNAFIEAFKSYPSYEKGILLKINAETEKAIIFWAHGCDIAPSPPICSGAQDRPRFRITLKQNSLPTLCTLKYPSKTVTLTKEPTIALEPNPSIDLDGNTVSYLGRVCTDISCEVPLWEANLEVGTKSYTDLADGEYFLSCAAQDGHQGVSWGDSFRLLVDTEPPASPVLVDEPPYTGSLANTLTWLPNSIEIVEYQVLSSERSDFRSYNVYSPWLSENRYIINHTKEKGFYYKVKARDKAGNESLWSNASSTIIDSTIPTIRYFKTNKSVMSPKYSNYGVVAENAYLQGGIEDATIDTLWIEIEDSMQRLVYTERIEDKSYLWTHWPEKSGYSDGVYLARLSASDSVGNIIQSDALILTLDTTPPAPPKIVGIKDKQLFMIPKISLTVSCTETAQSTIYLGGKIIASGKVSHSLILSQKKGTHTLTAKCTDLVENISERTLTFTVDITSPSSPSISYEIDKDTQKLAISIYCREEAVAEIFTHGTLLSSGTCKRNTYFTYVYKEQVDLPFYVTYTARLIDKAGNKSALNEKTVFIAAKTASVKQRMCSASYDLHTSAFNLTTCNWDQDDLEYQKTTSNGKRFESTVSVKSEKIASVALTVFTCKQKTLWDPKTWFSCVRIIAQEQKLDGQLIPILNSKEELHSVSNEQLSIYHDKVETFSVKKRYLLRFSATVGAGIISNETLSPESNTTFTPKYGSLTNTKYFSWIFSRPKEVNQWHGITAFQKPHGGIDFAVSKETILAPAKGKIISVGHAKAKVCNDGGNYLGVSHNNGLYTYYFHLASVNYGNGKAIKKGDTIEQGIKLATSGNTGQYNCEPLGAHLHFEVRKSGSASSHINPVPYFDVDWNTIVTSRAKAIPGRLTGDNPHPKF